MIGNDFLCTVKKDYEEKKFLRGGNFNGCQGSQIIAMEKADEHFHQ